MVVDVGVDGLEGDVGAQRVAQRVEERAVGDGVPEVAALDVGEREAARRRDDAAPGRSASFRRSATSAPELGLLVARRGARASRPGCGSSSCGRGSARAACRAAPWLKKSTQPGTTTCGRPWRPATRQPLRAGRVDARPSASWRARRACSRRRPASAPSSHRCSIAGPPTPLAWKITGSCPASTSALAQAHHAGRRLAEHRDPDAVLAERAERGARVVRPSRPSPRRRCRRSAARSPLSPRMSTTECITQTSLSPTKSPNARGGRRRRARRAASARRPAAPASRPRPAGRPRRRPRQSTPCDAALGEQPHARPRARPRASAPRPRRASRPRARRRASCPPARATSSRLTSAATVGSPRMPESITTASTRRARSGGRARRRSRRPWCRACRSARPRVAQTA